MDCAMVSFFKGAVVKDFRLGFYIKLLFLVHLENAKPQLTELLNFEHESALSPRALIVNQQSFR
jgi:hypothetical protein